VEERASRGAVEGSHGRAPDQSRALLRSVGCRPYPRRSWRVRRMQAVAVRRSDDAQRPWLATTAAEHERTRRRRGRVVGKTPGAPRGCAAGPPPTHEGGSALLARQVAVAPPPEHTCANWSGALATLEPSCSKNACAPPAAACVPMRRPTLAPPSARRDARRRRHWRRRRRRDMPVPRTAPPSCALSRFRAKGLTRTYITPHHSTPDRHHLLPRPI
jgi:hypothetical protein